MKSKVLLILMLAGWLVGLSAGAGLAADGGTVRIGKVSMKKIFDNFQKVKETEKILQQEKERENSELQKIKDRADAIQREMDSLPKDDASRPQKENELARLKEERNARIKKWNDYITKRIENITLDLYAEIKKQVTDFAAKKGYDLILKIEATDSSDSVLHQTAAKMIAYTNKKAVMKDLTGDITDIINGKKSPADKDAAAGGVKLKIGSISIKELYDAYFAGQDTKKMTEIQKAKRQIDINEIKDKIARLQWELNSGPGGNIDRYEKETELARLKEELGTLEKELNDYVKDETGSLFRDAYKTIKEKVKTFAENKGYDLVLKLETPDSADDVTLRIIKEGITYRNKNVVITDITNDIAKLPAWR